MVKILAAFYGTERSITLFHKSPPPLLSGPVPNHITPAHVFPSHLCITCLKLPLCPSPSKCLTSSVCLIKILRVNLITVFHATCLAYHIIFYRSSHCYMQFPYSYVSSILLSLSVFIGLFAEKCNTVYSSKGLFKITNLFS